MGGLSDDVLLARAFLSRVAEPACIPLWNFVRTQGPVDAVDRIRAGKVPEWLTGVVAARAGAVDPEQDLAAAARHEIRLVAPESDDWPHFAFAALEHEAHRRVVSFGKGQTAHAESGELIPPLALWVRGNGSLRELGTRSVGIVGARAATPYGEFVARDLARGLARRQVAVVSGGAYGIDAAAHRGALSAQGTTVIVSAGGVDTAYPPGHRRLFDEVAQDGVILSESPPGATPQRRRFLTRNRLIAALSTACVVVEAARRSGAMNTAAHCRGLGRTLMAVPGPVTSAMSVGCHQLLASTTYDVQLVTQVADVAAAVGAAEQTDDRTGQDAAERPTRKQRLDGIDVDSRRVFDGFPASGSAGVEELAFRCGLEIGDVLTALPTLELAGLIQRQDGAFTLRR